MVTDEESRTRTEAGPPPLTVRLGPRKLRFDGWSLDVVNPLRPRPERRCVRYPLRAIAVCEARCAAGSQERLGAVYLRPHDEPRVTLHEGLVRSNLEGALRGLAATVEAAVADRVRLVLSRSLGLGPWSADTLAEAERLVPELAGWPDADLAGSPEQRLRHINRLLCAVRGEPDPRAPLPVAPPAEDSGLVTATGAVFRRADDRPWRSLLDRLEGGREVTAGTEWETLAAARLAWGRMYTAGLTSHARYLRRRGRIS